MLKLRIVSDQRRSLAERSSTVFTVEGGTIGRAADNDWVLPDPLRYVSAHHARVQFRDGQFYLQDVSTNGIFVNDDTEALAKRGSSGYLLANGDVLRMGEYHILASLEQQAEAGDPAAAAVPTSIHGLRTLGAAPQVDIGSPLNLEELLVPDAAVDPPGLPVSAYGQPVNSGRVRALANGTHAPAAEDGVAFEFPPSEVDPAVSLGERMARLARAVGREPLGAALALEDVQRGLEAFCRGAGIEPALLPAGAQVRLLHLAGRLFREALVGFKEIDRIRTDTRNRYRIEMPTAQSDDPRPSLTNSVVENLLVALFVQHEGRALDSVQWLRETVGEAKLHETAVSQATRAAFVEFLDRLDPAELEARFERAARRGKARSADKAQYWDLFTTFYRNLIEMPADHLPHTFVEAFAAAYREALTTQREAQKKPASA
jgi:type VI secretion system FHA domain protein